VRQAEVKVQKQKRKLASVEEEQMLLLGQVKPLFGIWSRCTALLFSRSSLELATLPQRVFFVDLFVHLVSVITELVQMIFPLPASLTFASIVIFGRPLPPAHALLPQSTNSLVPMYAPAGPAAIVFIAFLASVGWTLMPILASGLGLVWSIRLPLIIVQYVTDQVLTLLSVYFLLPFSLTD
jgi:hypothetical protein